MSVNNNYTLIQGDSFQIQVAWYDSNNSIINLSGYSAVFEVRDQPGGSILCTSGSLGSIPSSGSLSGLYLSTPSASTGIININVPGTITNNFNYPRSSYQLRVQSSSGIRSTLVQGWISVNAGTIEI